MKPNGRSRTEWRRGHGDRSPDVKKRRSCSPLRKRRRSQSPGVWGKEHNAHEVLKGILKKSESGKAHRKIFQEDKILEKEVKIARKKETIPQGSKSSSRRSPSPGRRWGHESVRHSPSGNHGGRSSRWRRSPSPYAGSRKGRLEKRTPQRRLRDLGGDGGSLRYQHMSKEEEEVRMGDGHVQEGRWRSSKERRVGQERKRSSSREDLVSSSSSRNGEGYRKVYISWDRFVRKSFLHVHFSRFGEVEHIWMAADSFYGFVSFVREEVGRSLVGACHDVEGVQITIKRARPDWKLRDRERRSVPTCAFFKEGRCLRREHCQFLHTVELRSSGRSRERSGSREKARRKESSSVNQGVMRDRDVSSKKEGRKLHDLLEEGPSERDGRLRPPPSVQEKVTVRKILPLPVSARSAEVRNKEEISKEEELKKVGDVEARPRNMRGNEPKAKSSCDNMDPDAMKERIRQLEEALKEKEEAEDRKKRFLKAGKHDKNSRMKGEEAKLSGQSSRGSRKNCHLVKSLAKRFKRVENESTSSSSEDTTGYDSTSDGNTPSRSPSPPVRKPKVKTPESWKTQDDVGEVSGCGKERRVEGAGAKEDGADEISPIDVSTIGKEVSSNWGKEKIEEEQHIFKDEEGAAAKKNWGKEIPSKEAEEERERPSMSGQDSDCDKENIEEKEQVTNEEVEDQKKTEEGEEDGVDVNENMLGSEKEAVFGKDLDSADLSKVRVESACLINRLDNLESDFDALQEEEDARLESDPKKAAVGETEEAEERARRDEAAAAKKEKHEERVKALVMLTQERDRLRREEEERKKAESSGAAL